VNLSSAPAIQVAGRSTRVEEEVRILIRQMKVENADWGAPKIHGSCKSSGSTSPLVPVPNICDAAAAERQARSALEAFVTNHSEVIVAFDFSTVLTLTFKLLYCFLIIEHGRRKILHCNATTHSTSEWLEQAHA
jgi:putative transposase